MYMILQKEKKRNLKNGNGFYYECNKVNYFIGGVCVCDEDEMIFKDVKNTVLLEMLIILQGI